VEENKLLEFCKNKEIDWRGDELVIWIDFHDLSDFTDIVGHNYLSEGGHDTNLQKYQVALDLVPICEYLEIEPIEILEKTGEEIDCLRCSFNKENACVDCCKDWDEEED